MTTFDQREDAFERRFILDEALSFRAHARRDHRLGLWAAGELGLEPLAAKAYAEALVALAVVKGGSAVVLTKVMGDFAGGRVSKSEHQVRRRMDEMLAEAEREVRAP